MTSTVDLERDIELRGVAKTFRTAGTVVPAVRGIDVSIAAGETVALFGPNGAGKSTTIDMLLGLTAPDHGSVSLFGRGPGQAVSDGLIGAMLQVGALIRDVTPRELLDDDGVALPERRSRSSTCSNWWASPRSPIGERRSCPAGRRSGCALRWRWCPIRRC